MALFNDVEKRRLAQLCTLIYLKGVADQNGATIGEVVDDLLSKNGLEKSRNENKKGTREEYPCFMSKEEWSKVLTYIKNDPELCSYAIENGVDKNGLRAICCVNIDKDNKAGEVTVVFMGTAKDQYVWRGRDDISPKSPTPEEKERRIWRKDDKGIGHFEEISEWHDNGEGGYLSDTEQQRSALAYIEKLPYNNITVAGHSKGGNKAQYVAILSDKVKRGFSFNGQGFSPEFIGKYRKEIINNCHKLLSLAAENDFVYPLLPTIAPIREHFKVNTEDFANTNTEKKARGSHAKMMEPLQKTMRKLKDYPRNHCPHFAFNERGDLRPLAKQGLLPRFINNLTTYAVTTLKDPKREYVIDGLIANFEKSPNREGKRQRLMAAAIMVSIVPAFAWNQIKEKPGTDIYSVLKKIGKNEEAKIKEYTQTSEEREKPGAQQRQTLINVNLDGKFTINKNKAENSSKEEVITALQKMYNNIETQLSVSQKTKTKVLDTFHYNKLGADKTFSASPSFNYAEKSNAFWRNYTASLTQMTDSFLHAINDLNENGSEHHYDILSAFAKDASDSLTEYEKENKEITATIGNKNPARQIDKEDTRSTI